MNGEDEDLEHLAALLEQARGVYDCRVRFALTRAQVIALVRGLVTARPDLTVAELRELAGRAGVPTSVLVRVGRSEPPPARTVRWNPRARTAPAVW
ncbi:MAG: hypothetical protein E6G67_12970 [Actinobacteria bacterium]|nr:MAG: hypothetical protein E6G67_12970 [Actinomycetota bacterium]